MILHRDAVRASTSLTPRPRRRYCDCSYGAESLRRQVLDVAYAGFVLCDDIVQLYQDELTKPLGALCPSSVRAVSDGLRVALGLS